MRWRLGILVGLLLGLLAWVWATDRPSPAYPHGQLGPMVGWAGLVVGLTACGVFLWRVVRGTGRRRPPEDIS